MTIKSRLGWISGAIMFVHRHLFHRPEKFNFSKSPCSQCDFAGHTVSEISFSFEFPSFTYFTLFNACFLFFKSFSNVNKTENWPINVRNILTENVNAIQKSLLESKCGHKYRIFSHDCSVMLAAFSSDKIDGIFKQTRHTHTCDYKQFHFCRFNHHKCIFQTLFICFGISISEKWSYNAAQNTKYTQQTHRKNKKKNTYFPDDLVQCQWHW